MFCLTLSPIRIWKISVWYLAIVPFRTGALCPISPLFALWANHLDHTSRGVHTGLQIGQDLSEAFLLWEVGSRQQRNTTLWRHHNLDELWFHSSQVAVTTQTLICNSLMFQSVKNNKPTNQPRKTPKAKSPNQPKPPPNQKTPQTPTNTKNPELFYFLTSLTLMNLRQGILLILYFGHIWFCSLYISVDEAVRETVFFMKKYH